MIIQKKLLIIAVLIQSFSCFGISGAKIIDKIKHNFQQLQTYSLNFKQIQYLEFSNDSIITTGKIYYKIKDNFRIEQGRNYIISNGKTIYRYSDQTKQVLIEEIKENKDVFLPGKLFYDFTENYDLAEYKKEKDKFILKMKAPLNNEKFIHTLDVYVDKDYYVYRVNYYDLDDNKTVLNFLQRKKNPKLSKNIFKFIPQKGIDVQDLR